MSVEVKRTIEVEAGKQNVVLPGKKHLDGFYIFYSYDLVNSTKYKEVNKDTWPTVIKKFYEFIEEGFEKRATNVRLWKYMGDEVLLYKKVRSINDLHDCLSKAYDVLKSSILGLYRFPDTKTILSIKATVWFAKVSYIPPQDIDAIKDLEWKNICIDSPQGTEKEGVDFLGPEMDTGFRISKHTRRERLVVSADLAYLLYKERGNICNEFERRLKIISYKTLKGIWDSRKYPVIWYENDWKNIGDTFLYDESFEPGLIKNILSDSKDTSIDRLEKVYSDLDKKESLERIWGELKTLSPEGGDEEKDGRISIKTPDSLKAEVHCVAVCFNNEGKILIAKRDEGKRRFPNFWEFGCGQIRMFESFEKCLQRNYLEDFDAELNFGRELQPIRTYTIKDKHQGREIPGIIFLAHVSNPDSVTNKKHSKIDWLNPNEIDKQLSGEKRVPDFEKTVEIASHAWKTAASNFN